MFSLRLILKFLIYSPAILAQGNFRLAVDWQVAVPIGGKSAMILASVCPNGTVYLTTKHGDTIAIDRAGKLVFHEIGSAFERVDAMACGPRNVLYVAGRALGASLTSLAVRPEVGSSYKITRQNLDYDIHAIAVIRPSLIAMAASGHRNFFPLHLVADTGTVVRSFGEANEPLDPWPARGFLLWSYDTQRLFFLPRSLLEIQIYDSQGNALMVRGLGPNRPIAAEWQEQCAVDKVDNAVMLPNGELFCQVSCVGSPDGSPSLLLIEKDFNFIFGDVRLDLGIPQGSDSGGGLYLLRGSYLTRARLLRTKIEKPFNPNATGRAVARVRCSIQSIRPDSSDCGIAHSLH